MLLSHPSPLGVLPLGMGTLVLCLCMTFQRLKYVNFVLVLQYIAYPYEKEQGAEETVGFGARQT